MSISWIKTIDIINTYRLEHQQISRETGLDGEVLAKLRKNAPMSMGSLEILRDYLSKVTGRDLQPSDLFEFRKP